MVRSRHEARAAQEGATGAMLLAFILYYHGVSLEVIGRFFDVHKTTVMRWLSPLAQINWQAAVHQGTRFFSGTVAVDEKWIRSLGSGGICLWPSIMSPGCLYM